MREGHERPKRFLKKLKPKLIAIVGGSGAGKTWLAEKLKMSFAGNATRLSLDDFYRDRSHLTAKRRGRINFDHPRAIDWKNVESVLGKFAEGQSACAPKYNFATHTCAPKGELMKPKSLVIVDGLWLLRRPTVRKLFTCCIFINCPRHLRLSRRLKRDLQERGRNRTNIRKQFLQQVAPMHERYVSPQVRCAHIVITNPSDVEVTHLAEKIKAILKSN